MNEVISFVALAIGRGVSASCSARMSPEASSTSSQLPAGRPDGGSGAASAGAAATSRAALAASAARVALSGGA
jgi:hypothetical protein